MVNRRPIWLRFFWLAALCLFFTQSAICLAEHASLIDCHEAAEVASGCDDGSHTHDSSTNAHCCHLETNATPQFAAALNLRSTVITEQLSLKDEAVLDGPAREIDHPPQLS